MPTEIYNEIFVGQSRSKMNWYQDVKCPEHSKWNSIFSMNKFSCIIRRSETDMWAAPKTTICHRVTVSLFFLMYNSRFFVILVDDSIIPASWKIIIESCFKSLRSRFLPRNSSNGCLRTIPCDWKRILLRRYEDQHLYPCVDNALYENSEGKTSMWDIDFNLICMLWLFMTITMIVCPFVNWEYLIL